MMLDGQPERHFCISKTGRTLFYIDLIYDEELVYIGFDTSLRFPLYDFQHIVKLIGEITNSITPSERRDELIQELFLQIQNLPGIKSAYLSNDLLDESGKYLDYYDSVTSTLLQEKDFDDYTVFSPLANAFYYDYIKFILYEEFNKSTAVPVSKFEFENLVKNSFNLAQEYVSFFSIEAQFYKSKLSPETGFDCYFMVVASDVKLAFVLRI